MIRKSLFFPVWMVKTIIGLIISLVKMVLSLGFGTFRMIIGRLFGVFFGALIGFFLGKKHLSVKLFTGKKR